MRKVSSFSRWSLLVAAACGLAMSCVADRAAHAETIDFTFTGPTFSITFDPSSGTQFDPSTMTSGASYSTSDLATLNTLLSADGSAYTFSSLGGTNNWSGAASGELCHSPELPPWDRRGPRL